MDVADVNSGTIDYDEFIAATMHMNKLEREVHLLATFTYFDKDDIGYLTIDKLWTRAGSTTWLTSSLSIGLWLISMGM
jgi:Ca2+-binding EF-hand superfamily protein